MGGPYIARAVGKTGPRDQGALRRATVRLGTAVDGRRLKSGVLHAQFRGRGRVEGRTRAQGAVENGGGDGTVRGTVGRDRARGSTGCVGGSRVC